MGIFLHIIQLLTVNVLNRIHHLLWQTSYYIAILDNTVNFQASQAQSLNYFYLPLTPFSPVSRHQVLLGLHQVPSVCPLFSCLLPSPFWAYSLIPQVMPCIHIRFLPSFSGFLGQPACLCQKHCSDNFLPLLNSSRWLFINKSSLFIEAFLWSSLNLSF